VGQDLFKEAEYTYQSNKEAGKTDKLGPQQYLKEKTLHEKLKKLWRLSIFIKQTNRQE
jgi:hypothetical protein